eukprot:gene12602-12392_t
MLESGLEVVQYNCNRKNQSLALFEFGNVYMTVKGKYQGGEIQWKRKGKVLARAWRVSKERLNLFDIKQDVFYAEVDWQAWVEAASAARTRYTEIPKFPAVQRDLALVLDKQVTYEQVREVTAKLNLGELQAFGLFDVFESEKLGAGKKSY